MCDWILFDFVQVRSWERHSPVETVQGCEIDVDHSSGLFAQKQMADLWKKRRHCLRWGKSSLFLYNEYIKNWAQLVQSVLRSDVAQLNQCLPHSQIDRQTSCYIGTFIPKHGLLTCCICQLYTFILTNPILSVKIFPF